MSKEKLVLEYANQIPFVPVNWQDRDTLTGRICNILEAVMSEGNQLEKTKDLVKELTKQYWIDLFNNQFDALTPHKFTGFTLYRTRFSKAIWELQQEIGTEIIETQENSTIN